MMHIVGLFCSVVQGWTRQKIIGIDSHQSILVYHPSVSSFMLTIACLGTSLLFTTRLGFSYIQCN